MSSTFGYNLAHMGVCSSATMGSYYTTDTQNTCHSCVNVTYLALWVCVAIINYSTVVVVEEIINYRNKK